MTDPSELDRLAESVEAATVGQQGKLILAAFYAIHGPPMSAHVMAPGPRGAWIEAERIMIALVRAGEETGHYESAAMTLVPEDADWFYLHRLSRLGDGGRWEASVMLGDVANLPTFATSALALVAACLRAQSTIAREAASKARAKGVGES